MNPVLCEIHQIVESSIHHNSQMSSSFLKDALVRVCSRIAISDLLKTILDDEEHLNIVARLSYRHINGFDKIVLFSGVNNEFKLRLHIWWPMKLDPLREHIHNHRWNFATTIILGSYRLETYIQAKRGEPVYSYSYWSPEEQNAYKMRLKGKVFANKTLDVDLSQGAIYQLEHSVLHRVTTANKNGTVSLMLQGAPLKKSTHVLTDAVVDNPEKMPAERFRIDTIANRLNECLNLLNSEKI